LPSNIHLPASKETRLQALKSPDAAKATVTEHWGQRDQPAVVEYVLNQFKGSKLVVLGHSVGGTAIKLHHLSLAHIMALLPETLRSQIFRAVFISANNPNWQYVPPKFVPTFREIWTKTRNASVKEGYLPRSASFFGVTLPAGPAIEWSSGMLSEDKRYLAGTPKLTSFYTSWEPKNEIISIAFKDDITIMRQEEPVPIDAWCEIHTKAKITRVLLSPDEYGGKEIGHVGMFKDGHEDVWELIRNIIMDGKIPDKGKTRRWNQGKSRL